jgi:probable rRNA maturation factor
MKENSCRAQVLNRQRRYRVFPKAVSQFCNNMFEMLELRGNSMSIVFIGHQKMQDMNRRFRGKDYPADVLSFRYPGAIVEGSPFLGEIVICPEVASGNARKHRTSHETEIRRLLLHGILHLLGYDHERDDGEMKRFQAALQRRRAFLNSPPLAAMKGK